MSEIGVLVTISYVEIPYQDYCVIYICYILSENLEDSLIVIWVYVNHVVCVLVIMKGQDVDIVVVDDIKLQSESHLCKAFVDVSSDLCIVFLYWIWMDEQGPFWVIRGTVK